MDKSLMKKATADTPEPTPGYMYRDIIAMTFTDMKTQDKILQFLIEKISDTSSSTHVLSKTLRIIKHLCEKGHADFQKEMQRHADQIKVCAQFRGKADPTFGDMLNQQVRDAAREAMEATFNSRRAEKANVDTTGQAGKADDVKEVAKGAGSFTTGTVHTGGVPKPTGTQLQNAAATVQDAVKTGFGLWKETPKSANDKMLEDMYNSQHTQGQYVMPSLNDVATVPIPMSTGSAAGQDWKTLTQNAAASAPAVKVQSPAQRHVEKLVLMKNTPQRLELSNFHQGGAAIVEDGTATWDDVAAALDESMAGSNNWQIRLNALCGLEVLAKTGVKDVIQYFTENPEEVQKNVNVVQSTLKDRAVKVLTILNLPTQAPNKPQAVPAAVFSNAGSGTAKGEMSWGASLAPCPQGPTPDGLFADAGSMKVRDRQKDKTTKLKKRAPGMGVVAEEEYVAPPLAPVVSAPVVATPQPRHGTAVAPSKPQYDILDDLFGGPMPVQQSQPPAKPPASGFSFM